MVVAFQTLATQAAQLLGVLDSGESLSAQQLTDTLGFANNILDNWTNEEALALQVLAMDQAKALQVLSDQQGRAAALLADDQSGALQELLDRQTRALAVLIADQSKELTQYVNQLKRAGQILRDDQSAEINAATDQQARIFFPVQTGYTLAGGTYTKATSSAGTYTAATFTAASYTGGSITDPSVANPTFTAPSYTPGAALSFTSTSASITAPEGYARALTLALAVEMAPYWQTAASADLARMLAEARAAASPVGLPVPGTAGQRVWPSPNDQQSPAAAMPVSWKGPVPAPGAPPAAYNPVSIPQVSEPSAAPPPSPVPGQ